MLLLFAGLFMPTAKAQSVIIQNNDGTESSELLNNIVNLTFTSDLMNVKTTSQTTSFTVSDIRKIYFDNVVVVGVDQIAVNGLVVYPNPVTNLLKVRFDDANSHSLFIYRIDGVLVFRSGSYTSDQVIEVGQWSKGLYLVRLDNQVVKFEKL